jgi:AcrR family transcriptional regulator
VPKISAATTAEHRELQRAALVRAARELLETGGYEALSFQAVAARAGLARPSVYWYFKSRDDLVVAVCEEGLPRWLERISRAMARARTPRAQVVAFVRAQLEAAGEGEHRIAQLVVHASLSPEARTQIQAIHERLAPNVTDALASLGHPHPGLAAGLVQGVVSAGVARVNAGEPAGRVIRAATDLIMRGVSPTGCEAGAAVGQRRRA